MKNLVMKWLADFRAELPFFTRLLGSVALLLRRLVCREDVAEARNACVMLLEETHKCQIVALVSLALVVVLVMRGCGRAALRDGDGVVHSTTAQGHRETHPSPPPQGKPKSRFDAETLARRVHPIPLASINFKFGAPEDGAVVRNWRGTMRVMQVLDDGVLARFSAFDDVIIIHVNTARQYADGEYLAEGYYVSSGKYSYITTKGARATVCNFEEVPEDVQRRISELVGQMERDRAEKQQQLEQARQKREKEEKAKQDIHVPSTPDEVIREMFGLDFNKEGGELCFCDRLRIECPFVWGKFCDANEDELNKLKSITQDKEVIRLFAKWLCDNKWTDARIGYKGYIDHFMSELQFSNPLENVIVQKSLRDKLIIECHPFAEKLRDMHVRRDWLGLMNVAYENQNLVFDRLPEDWSVSSRGIEKLATMTIPMEIRAAEGATVQMNMLKIEKVVAKSNFKMDVVAFGDRADKISLTEKRYIRTGGSEPDKALAALREGFLKKHAEICREYKWKGGESDRKVMAQRLKQLESEFIKQYEDWLNAN